MDVCAIGLEFTAVVFEYKGDHMRSQTECRNPVPLQSDSACWDSFAPQKDLKFAKAGSAVLWDDNVKADPDSIEVDGLPSEDIVPFSVRDGWPFASNDVGFDFLKSPSDLRETLLSGLQSWLKSHDTGFTVMCPRHGCKESVELLSGLLFRAFGCM